MSARTLLLVLLVVVSISCIDSTGVKTKIKQVRAATWNVGLFTWLDPTSIIKAIPKNYDVLALQEVWSQKVANDIIHKLKGTYKYSFYAPAKQGPNIGCLPSNPYCPYLGLPEEQCGSTLQYGAINCLQTFGIPTSTSWLSSIPEGPCLDILSALLATDATCAACLNNELHLLPDGPEAYQAVTTCATGQGHTYDFAGFPGVILLSKKPIKSVKVRDMSSFVVRRVIISADIDGVLYSCSHYPFDLEIPAPFPTPDFALQSAFAQKQIDSNADIILGDFNSGPEYQPEAYNLLLNSKYRLLTGEADTYCTPQLAGDARCAREVPLDIDHVFLSPKDKLQWKSKFDIFNNKPGLSDHAGVAGIASISKCRFGDDQPEEEE